MNTSEINALIRAYNHVKVAIQEADIPDNVLEALSRDRGDEVVSAQNALALACNRLARVIRHHTDMLKIEEIEEIEGIANN